MQRLFDGYIRHLLEERRPTTLLEIGVHSGQNTLKLLEWCKSTGSQLTSLDPVEWVGCLPEELKRPYPGYQYKRGQKEFDNFKIAPPSIEIIFERGLDKYWTCKKLRSLDYLTSPEFTGFDMYLIDGDHNYYTVSNELKCIHAKISERSTILFNDVAGVWARKDLYYDPIFIPAEHRNSPKQGVLTAIEDFLASFGRRRLFWRIGCPYQFRILTKKHDGLGLLAYTGNGEPTQ